MQGSSVKDFLGLLRVVILYPLYPLGYFGILLCLLLYATVVGLLIWVAIHFILKYW